MLLDEYMTTREVAEALKMKPAQVTRKVQRGEFEGAVKKDWFWMVPKSAVDKLRAQQRRQARREQLSAA